MLPVMVNLDGFLITHTYEPIELLDQKMVDEFLPPYKPLYALDPKNPVTMGALAQPEDYTEARYMVHNAQMNAKEVIEEVANDFSKEVRPVPGRPHRGIQDGRRRSGADRHGLGHRHHEGCRGRDAQRRHEGRHRQGTRLQAIPGRGAQGRAQGRESRLRHRQGYLHGNGGRAVHRRKGRASTTSPAPRCSGS